jgi:hypothetical protein
MRESKSWRIAALAVAFAIPTLSAISVATAETEKVEQSATGAISKEDQAKLKEHNKLRAAIGRVKYPAAKADVVSHVKGIKPDDKKWFEETLPDRTYDSANDVMAALGWETATPGSDDKTATHQPKSSKTGADGKSEKTQK